MLVTYFSYLSPPYTTTTSRIEQNDKKQNHESNSIDARHIIYDAHTICAGGIALRNR